MARRPAAGNAEDAGAQFDALYTAYRPFLRDLATWKFRIPPGDADDLVHDVFATYIAQRAAVREVRPYLIGAICRASRHYLRRGEASPFSPRPEHRECGATEDDELMVMRSLMARRALSRLGKSCRDALQQFYLMGESAGAIAAQRQTSANYIHRLLNLCRNRARSIYEEMSNRS